MADTLYRDEVIEAQRDRLTGTIIAATPPRARIYGALLGGAAVAMLLFLIFGSFATRAMVTGAVAYDHGVARIYPPSPVEIRKLPVREGDDVRAGQTLATVAVTQGRDIEGEGVDSQLTQLARQDDELVRQQKLAETLLTDQLRNIEGQQDSLTLEIGSLRRQRSLSGAQVKLAESAHARAARLAKKGAGSARRTEEAGSAALTRRADFEALGERLTSQREALRVLGNQLDQARLTTEQRLSEISAQRADLAARRSALLRLDRLQLTAPFAGRVSDLVATVGQRAQPETSLMTIVPDDSRLEVWLYAPSRAAGFVQPGQQVRLMFDAFPYQKYGPGSGTVLSVSSVPTDPGAIDPGLQIKGPVYRLRVRIDAVPGDVTPQRPLRAGMTLSANLVLERRKLWEFFLDPILRIWRR